MAVCARRVTNRRMTVLDIERWLGFDLEGTFSARFKRKMLDIILPSHPAWISLESSGYFQMSNNWSGMTFTGILSPFEKFGHTAVRFQALIRCICNLSFWRRNYCSRKMDLSTKQFMCSCHDGFCLYRESLSDQYT